MRRNIPAGITILALSLLLGACSGEPNSSGAGLLPDTLVIVTGTGIASADTNYLRRVGGNLTDLLVGRTTDLESRSLMEFSFPPFDSSAKLDSGILVMHLKYRMPQSGGTLEFEVHRMLVDWNDAAFRWDSLPNSFDPSVSGSFSAAIGTGDSLLRVPIDTSLIRAWFDTGRGSIMLVPTGNSTMIAGFHSHLLLTQGLQPVLEISYREAADTTVVMKRNAIRGVFISETTMSPPPPGSSVLQGGVSLRSRISFDSLSLPPGAGIADAILEVTADTVTVPAQYAVRDTLSVSFLQDHEFPLDSLALSVFGLPSTVGGRKVFRADVKTFLQLWNTREPNLGISLRAIGDLTNVDRIGIFDSSAPDSLRPRIIITYTKFP